MHTVSGVFGGKTLTHPKLLVRGLVKCSVFLCYCCACKERNELNVTAGHGAENVHSEHVFQLWVSCACSVERK